MYQQAKNAFLEAGSSETEALQLKATEFEKNGNKFFKKGDYQTALEQYNQSIKLGRNLAIIWCYKGLAHKELHQYAEALVAFSKAKKIDSNYEKAAIQNIKPILEEILKSNEVLPHYTGDFFRPLVCQQQYLEFFTDLRKKSSQCENMSFSDQVQLIVEQINFIIRMLPSAEKNSFLIDGLCDDSDFGREIRLNKIGNRLILSLKGLTLENILNTDEFLSTIDRGILSMVMVIRDDIYFEDTKIVFRAIFETIHKIPRNERGGLIENMPWHENSWYFFDFLGAVFIGDDAIDRENQRGGISVPTYNYEGNVAKQKTLALYLSSLMNHTSIVKIAMQDVVSEDLLQMKDFFEKLLSNIQKSEALFDFKMGELPNLRAILWYSKQTYNIRRLLCLLPAVPGNSMGTDFDPAASGILTSTNTEKEIDMVRYIKQRGFKEGVPQVVQDFIIKLIETNKKAGNKITGEDLIKFGITEPSKITYGLEPPIGPKTADFLVEKSKSIPVADRLMLASGNNYLDIRTLSGRFALLRKLQLIGEIFIPRNWGNHLKYIDYLRPERLSAIRDGLVHIEDCQYGLLTIKLESDQETLSNLFRELQTLKEEIYEQIVIRQAEFPEWPNDGSFDPKVGKWKDFSRIYWHRVKEFYCIEGELDFSNYITNERLLEDVEIDIIANMMQEREQSNIQLVLSGKKPFVKLEDYLGSLKPESDIKQQRSVRKLLEKAEKHFKGERKIFEDKIKKDKKTEKEMRLAKIKDNMSTKYSTIEEWGKNFWDAGDKTKSQGPDKEGLLYLLHHRMNALKNLILENKINFDNKQDLADKLYEYSSSNMALLLSVNYVLGHIVSLLNKIHTLLQFETALESRFPAYLALRNHLEHIDPILESADLPYYHMDSSATKIMSVVVSELICDHWESIFNFKNMPEACDGVKDKVKQQKAINLALFFPEILNFYKKQELQKTFEKTIQYWEKKGFEYNEDIELQKAIVLSREKSGNIEKQKDYFASLGFGRIEDVPADGFCLFHAVARQIEEHNIVTHRLSEPSSKITTGNIIEIIEDYLVENWTNYQDFFVGNSPDERYAQFLYELERYLTLGNYAQDIGDLMPQILSDALGITIIVYDATTKTQVAFNENQQQPIIRLGRVDNIHYLCVNSLPSLSVSENDQNRVKDFRNAPTLNKAQSGDIHLSESTRTQEFIKSRTTKNKRIPEPQKPKHQLSLKEKPKDVQTGIVSSSPLLFSEGVKATKAGSEIPSTKKPKQDQQQSGTVLDQKKYKKK